MAAESGQHYDVCRNEAATVARNYLLEKGAMTLPPLPQISKMEGEVAVCFTVVKHALPLSPILQLADNHHAGCRKGPSQSELFMAAPTS